MRLAIDVTFSEPNVTAGLNATPEFPEPGALLVSGNVAGDALSGFLPISVSIHEAIIPQ